MIFRKKKDLDDAMRANSAEIAELNIRLASELIQLAGKTGDIEPLIEAAAALSKSQNLLTPDTATEELARIQKSLGDTLLKTGKAENNKEALLASIACYKGAITVSSILGLSQLRTAAKKNLALAENIAGLRRDTPSSYFAA